jgi:putative endonuclease
LAFGSPLEAVTPVKQQRIRRLAAAWLHESGGHASDIRFDVAAVLDGTVEVVQNAF